MFLLITNISRDMTTNEPTRKGFAKWKGRNFIREIRKEQEETRIKEMQNDPTYRKLEVKHHTSNE